MIARRKTLIRFCVYKRKHVRVHGALIRINFANSRGVLLFEMGFFSRWSSFRDYFCKLKRGASFRDGLLFEMDFLRLNALRYLRINLNLNADVSENTLPFVSQSINNIVTDISQSHDWECPSLSPHILLILLLGAGRRPCQGSTSVFCYYYLWCSRFPARLQSLNSVTKPDQIHEIEISSF